LKPQFKKSYRWRKNGTIVDRQETGRDTGPSFFCEGRRVAVDSKKTAAKSTGEIKKIDFKVKLADSKSVQDGIVLDIERQKRKPNKKTGQEVLKRRRLMTDGQGTTRPRSVSFICCRHPSRHHKKRFGLPETGQQRSKSALVHQANQLVRPW
jgi:hypothetical protein